jgi:hypothetical protein
MARLFTYHEKAQESRMDITVVKELPAEKNFHVSLLAFP